MRASRLPIFFSIPFLMVSPFSAMSRAEDEHELFQRFAREHQVDLAELEESRGRTLGFGSDDALGYSAVLDVLALDYGARCGVVFYGHDGNHLHVWLFTAGQWPVYDATPATLAEIDALIAGVRSSIGVGDRRLATTTRGSTPVDDDGTLIAHEETAELARVLFPQAIQQFLAERSSSEIDPRERLKDLVVVPFGNIGTIPFALLTPFGTEECLIERVTISIAESIHDLEHSPPYDWRSLRFGGQKPDLELRAAIVGVASFPHEDGQRFKDLPGVKQEIDQVSSLLNVRPLLNEAATVSAVGEAVANANLLYFATHGFTDERDGYLALWPDNDSGIWSGQQIHDAEFSDDVYLAILSACQTGLGPVHDAGVVGVARSFQMGGVSRVVVSLWDVRDRETAEFMQILIPKLTETHVAEALRLSMLEMRAKHPAPAAWAAFTFLGTPL